MASSSSPKARYAFAIFKSAVANSNVPCNFIASSSANNSSQYDNAFSFCVVSLQKPIISFSNVKRTESFDIALASSIWLYKYASMSDKE